MQPSIYHHQQQQHQHQLHQHQHQHQHQLHQHQHQQYHHQHHPHPNLRQQPSHRLPSVTVMPPPPSPPLTSAPHALHLDLPVSHTINSSAISVIKAEPTTPTPPPLSLSFPKSHPSALLSRRPTTHSPRPLSHSPITILPHTPLALSSPSSTAQPPSRLMPSPSRYGMPSSPHPSSTPCCPSQLPILSSSSPTTFLPSSSSSPSSPFISSSPQPPPAPSTPGRMAARGSHWSFGEKARFETALLQHGPFAWRAIIRAVATRSEKQVKAYAARYRRRKKLAAKAAMDALRENMTTAVMAGFPSPDMQTNCNRNNIAHDDAHIDDEEKRDTLNKCELELVDHAKNQVELIKLSSASSTTTTTVTSVMTASSSCCSSQSSRAGGPAAPAPTLAPTLAPVPTVTPVVTQGTGMGLPKLQALLSSAGSGYGICQGYQYMGSGTGTTGGTLGSMTPTTYGLMGLGVLADEDGDDGMFVASEAFAHADVSLVEDELVDDGTGNALASGSGEHDPLPPDPFSGCI